MNTDDLIRALTTDAADKATMSLQRILALALLPALAICILLYAAMLGPRPHLLALMDEPRIVFKIIFPLLVAGCGAATLLRLARPASALRLCVILLVGLALMLVTAVIIELVVMPENVWMTRLIGHNARVCMRAIPMLALPPFLAIFAVTRNGAPTRPALAGAAIGLFAGAIGAAIYATHCPDDSPLFVATWYTLAIAAVTAVGAIVGSRFLRW